MWVSFDANNSPSKGRPINQEFFMRDRWSACKFGSRARTMRWPAVFVTGILLVTTEGRLHRKPLAAQLVGVQTAVCSPSGASCYFSNACCSKVCRGIPPELDAGVVPPNVCWVSKNLAYSEDEYGPEMGETGNSCIGAFQTCNEASDCCSGVCQPDIPYLCD